MDIIELTYVCRGSNEEERGYRGTDASSASWGRMAAFATPVLLWALKVKSPTHGAGVTVVTTDAGEFAGYD
eukprot:748176-Hanusia_phi.AAC.2